MTPRVSIIVPCYNEEATIVALLVAISQQTYPVDQLEVVIADGMSGDGTRAEIARFQGSHPIPRTRVVDNPAQTIPSGLNAAIRAAAGDILVRLDAHSMPVREYVERCVSALEAGRGDNVGGVWNIVPGGSGVVARSIAAAAAHPLGAGDALYRLGGSAREVETVPFGAFRRSLLERLGPFDEALHSNEDYEFNARLRRSGGKVWLDPAISSQYVARATLAGLGRQYWRYGFWKFRMLVRYPGTIRLRQALPPLFVLTLIVLSAATPFWGSAPAILAPTVGAYAAALFIAALYMGFRQRDARIVPAAMLALAVMHFAWGGGFLWSLVSLGKGSHG